MSIYKMASAGDMVRPDFGPLEETLLIPLLGRAQEMKRTKPLIKDERAVSITDQLDYDFGKFDNDISSYSMARTTVRTAIIDDWVAGLLKTYPKSTIIELGCGLNTRCSRIDNGLLNWYDLDTPPVFEVWKQFFEESPRRTFLPFSAFDDRWKAEVRHVDHQQVIIIAEASVIYFPAQQVEALIQSLRKDFPGGWYIFDSASRAFINRMERQDALKYCSARFQWAEEDSLSFLEALSYEKRLDVECALSEWLSDKTVNLVDITRKCLNCPGRDAYYLNLVKLD